MSNHVMLFCVEFLFWSLICFICLIGILYKIKHSHNHNH